MEELKSMGVSTLLIQLHEQNEDIASFFFPLRRVLLSKKEVRHTFASFVFLFCLGAVHFARFRHSRASRVFCPRTAFTFPSSAREPSRHQCLQTGLCLRAGERRERKNLEFVVQPTRQRGVQGVCSHIYIFHIYIFVYTPHIYSSYQKW
jgi:hypothetical protein